MIPDIKRINPLIILKIPDIIGIFCIFKFFNRASLSIKNNWLDPNIFKNIAHINAIITKP